MNKILNEREWKRKIHASNQHQTLTFLSSPYSIICTTKDDVVVGKFNRKLHEGYIVSELITETTKRPERVIRFKTQNTQKPDVGDTNSVIPTQSTAQELPHIGNEQQSDVDTQTDDKQPQRAHIVSANVQGEVRKVRVGGKDEAEAVERAKQFYQNQGKSAADFKYIKPTIVN